ncbi:MAG: cytochrome c maturation protein CcmE [Coriobacteriales bacterium]|nr:cytochrome c maturation protein CcmE [Coriobacteriales bacterium]
MTDSFGVKEIVVNSRLKRRLVVVTGVIVIVIVVVLAIVSSTTASHTISVAQAASGSYNGSKVQVTGKVVDNSFVIEGDVLSFFISEDAGAAGVGGSNDTNSSPSGPAKLKVIYDKGVSATFGNQVTAICTGTINQEGVLICTELVTQCPSKYENATTALGVSQLLDYGSDIFDKPVKVTGTIKAGTLGPVGQASRFVLVDATGGAGEARELPISYDGALSADIKDGATVVLTGSLLSLQKFEATEVALKA